MVFTDRFNMGLFRSQNPQDVPPVPDSLNHNSLELPDGHQEKIPGDRPVAATGITPYLGLRARLSQIWFNRWTILLILILIRVLIQIASLNDNLGDAQVKALAACSKVEDIGSAMASMPHYLSVGVNHLAADGIEKTLDGFVDILFMILTGVEALIVFVIEMYVGTYACLIAAFIHGGIDVTMSAISGTTDQFNKAVGPIIDTIKSDVSNFQNTINNALKDINNVGSFFGGSGSTIPTLDLTADLNKLNNIHINDSAILGDLSSLNSTIPTFDQVEQDAKNAINIPFDLLKQAVNTSFNDYKFDQSVFPVANKESLTFCSDNSKLVDFFAQLFHIVAVAKIVFLVVLIVLAVLAIVPMTFLEIRRYRKQRWLAGVITKHGYDGMDMTYMASRPYTAVAGMKIAKRFSAKRQILVRWAVAYGTTFPALFILSLAFAGLFSCLCQFILYRALQNEAPALAAEVGDFAGEVVNKLEDVSTQWAKDANGVVLGLQDDINKDVLNWVANATSSVNNTLNTFDTEIKDGITQVFKNTPLLNVVTDVFDCLVGRKIESIEAGLTWVHDQAHVTLPLFPDDLFSLGANSSITNDTSLTSFLSSPTSVTTDDITAAVDHVLNMLRNNIIQEALISAGLLLLYVIIVLVGIVRMLSAMAMSGQAPDGQRFVDPQVALDANKGTVAAYTGDNRPGPAPRSPRSRNMEDTSAGRFSEFDRGADSVSPIDDEYDAIPLQDEKGAHKQSVRAGKVTQEWRSHARQSSYGQVEDAGR
jgi:hypothetical protein